MSSYPKTNKNGCSGDEFRYMALFFAFAVVVLTIIAVSFRVEPYKIDYCTSHEDQTLGHSDCYKYLLEAIPPIMITTMVSALSSLVFLNVTLHIFLAKRGLNGTPTPSPTFLASLQSHPCSRFHVLWSWSRALYSWHDHKAPFRRKRPCCIYQA